jgi:hypothetical protein
MPDTKGCPNCRHACNPRASACEDCGYDFTEEREGIALWNSHRRKEQT